MKRGLAALAVSAVAAVGLPALAMANTVDSQVTGAVGPNSVQLYNSNGSFTGAVDLTAKNDGTDTTVRLEAGGGVNVPGVLFQAQVNAGAFFDVATVTSRNDDGAFSYEWAINDAWVGQNINLRVRNTADVNNVGLGDTAGPFVLRNASAITTQAINITAGEQRGYFFDPDDATPFPNQDATLGVTGTTTVLSTNPLDSPALAWENGAGVDQDGGYDTSTDGAGNWEGVLRFDGYPFDNPDLPPAEADQMVVRALTDTVFINDDRTDDFEAFTLYEQSLTSVSCTITPHTEPDPGDVTIKVVDQNGQPIAGIDVFERFLDGSSSYVNGPATSETNGRGEITVPQNDNAQYYYANADGPNAFSPGAGDKRSPDCNNQAAQVDITTAPSDGDVPLGTTVTETIKVTDPSGDPISNRPVRIKREGPQDQSETKFATTDDNGEVTYTFTCTVEGVANLEVGIRGPNPIPPNDDFTWAVGRDTVNCKNPAPPKDINVLLTGRSSQGKDILKVNAPSVAKGATVIVQKRTSHGWVTLGHAKKLDGAGNRQFGVQDKNGKRVTKYRARVSGNDKVNADTSPVLRLK